MPLTGQAKTDYQREYMRKRRAGSNTSVTPSPESVRPVTVKPVKLVRPEGVSDSRWNYIKMRAEQ